MRRTYMVFALMLMFAIFGMASHSRGHKAQTMAPVPAAAVTTSSPNVSDLPEPYQDMVQRLLSVPADERPPLAVCFSPDTDPAVVDRFNEIMASYGDALDYYLGGRWSTTANGSTGSQGNPATITYSFVPDGVSIPGNAGEPAAPNTLHATLNQRFGSESLWRAKFAQCFARWETLTGIHYQEVSDDGAPFPGSGGQLGVRGDVRIASHPIDGQYGILAYNFFPNTGDMVMDAGEPWGNSNGDYLFMRNIVMHEHGHGLGISHVCPTNQTKLMEPYLSLQFDGPQHDDRRAGQRNYGDTYENNDAYTTATDVGNGTVTISDVSLDNAADNDWYRFTVGAGTQVTATLTPVGATYYSDPQSGGCGGGSTQLNTINDQNLDLRLYGSDGSTVLATAASQPAGSPETLPSTALSAGTYYLRVQAGSSYDEVQLYSLAVTTGGGGGNPTPSLTVNSPNGGESWAVGGTVYITWSSSNLSENVRVELNRNYPSGTWEALATSTANDGTFDWVVAGAASTSARVRVYGASTTSVGDTSNANFTINGGTTGRTITVSSPNGGETWAVGEAATIRWTSTNLTGYVRIQLNRNYPGGTWETLASYTANDGVQTWNVSGAATTNARIRVYSTSYSGVSDESNASFTIGSGGGGGGGSTITVLAPNGGEAWTAGSNRIIHWTSSGVTGYVMIELNRNYPTGSWTRITSLTYNDGYYTWRVTTPATAAARIRISSVSNPAINDVSDANFSIPAAVSGNEGSGDPNLISDVPGAVPAEPYLAQNYPNPFNPSTTIEFGLPEAGRVKLAVYDITGREVAVLMDGEVSEGRHSINWSCSDCAVGLYLIVMTGDNFRQVQKAQFLK